MFLCKKDQIWSLGINNLQTLIFIGTLLFIFLFKVCQTIFIEISIEWNIQLILKSISLNEIYKLHAILVCLVNSISRNCFSSFIFHFNTLGSCPGCRTFVVVVYCLLSSSQALLTLKELLLLFKTLNRRSTSSSS